MNWKRLAFLGSVGLLVVGGAALVWWPEEPRQQRSAPSSAWPTDGPTGRPPSSRPPEIGPAVPAPADGGPAKIRPEPGLLARVNGEPIYSEDVNAGIGEDMIGPALKEARRNKLDRLIEIAAMRQHLKTSGISIPEEVVDKEVAELRRNPPAAGCSCCRYDSLEAFLAASMMTVKDLKDSIRNDLGLNRHVAALWSAECPPGEKRRTLLARERPRVEGAYVKLSHVFFNTVQQRDWQADPDGVRNRVMKRAQEAWVRLQKGEDFAKVASDCTEDANSKPKGGSLGCVPRSALGRAVEEAVGRLKPGECSRPVESPWGVHVIRREALVDQDILDVLESEFKDRKLQEMYASVPERAKVERFGE